ncbi:MAG: chromosome segregation protein SMC [Candidatus Woesearchaeota archaeon]
MTKINKLVMQGFKSFAKRTEVLLGEKFNCVLGPNGSGKSNIMDALCFVLGRGSAKSLRAEKSANLIYNGGKTKQAAKFGEVSIYFDNAKKEFPFEDAEIKLSRIVNQNGNSKYKINGKTSTKQEFTDLLERAKVDPDGLNIIMQGDIIHFVEMQPIERRKLVEEIAGISVYEEKKEKALKEMDNVQLKLNDAEIILNERKNYLKELKHDRDQALKFKELKDKVDENKASYLNIRIRDRSAIHMDFDEKLNKEKHKMDEIEKQIKEIKDANDKRKKEIESISNEIEQKGEKEQVTMHKEIEALKVQLGTDKNRMDACKTEIEKIKSRKTQLNNDITGHSTKIKAIEEDKTRITKDMSEKNKQKKVIDDSLDNFRKKERLDDLTEIEKEIEKIDVDGEELQKQILVIRQEQQDGLRKKDQLEFQIKTIDETIAKVKEVESENHAQIKDLKNRKELFKKKTLDLNQCLAEDSSLAARLREAKIVNIAAEEKASKLQAKNAGILEAKAGNMATKKIKELKKPGVYGTIGELGEVSSKYSLALEIAAGAKIESIVVDNDKIAAECISYLKKGKLGMATFVPLNKIKPVKESPEAQRHESSPGVHKFAIDLVKFEPKFKNAFSYVFGNTLVVDDIEVARKIGIGVTKMVTLDGDLADFSGIMRGGYVRRNTGTGFIESEVTKDIEKAQAEMAESGMLISGIERKRAENEAMIDKLRTEKAELEAEIITLEKTLHLDTNDLDSSSKQKSELDKQLKETDMLLKGIQSKITKVNVELAANKTKRQGLRDKISSLRNPRVLAELHTFEEQKKKLTEELMQLDADLKNCDVQISLIEPEKVKIAEIIKQHEKELEGFNTEISTTGKKVKEVEDALKIKEKQAEEFYKKYKDLFAKRSKLSEDISKEEVKVDSFRENSRKAEIAMNTLSLEDTHVRAELSTLNAEFEQYKGVKLNDLPEADLKKEIEKFEKMANNMGAVNMKALEIYEKVELEYNSLLEKKTSLGREKEDVLLLINEIETKKKDIFMDSFNILNQNFQNFFQMLSKKGEASLVLENPDKVFEEGLMIKVRLTGAKFLDIRSLSGGEKTMTALAFIFAIQENEPHSFYVLDEVDAALDKHNSEKLSKLIRKYCDNAQYLVISHNDSLIGEADHLYGISMDEHGMSNVTSLKL